MRLEFSTSALHQMVEKRWNGIAQCKFMIFYCCQNGSKSYIDKMMFQSWKYEFTARKMLILRKNGLLGFASCYGHLSC